MALPYLALAWFPAWRQCCRGPAPGWCVEAVARVSAVRDGGVARLGAGRAGRQRCRHAHSARLSCSWRSRCGRGERSAEAGARMGGSGDHRCPRRSPSSRGRSSARTAISAAGAARSSGIPVASDGWQRIHARALADGSPRARPVFVDFTAAWCVTCQVNKRLVLSDSGVKRAFARAEAALLRADWTRRDPEITRRCCGTRPQRRARLRALPQGARAAAAARSPAAAGADRRDRRLVATRGARPKTAMLVARSTREKS